MRTIGHGLLALALGAALLAAGCNAQQITTLESAAHKSATAAQATLVAYRNNEATIDEVLGAVAKILPETGSAHALAIDAATAAAVVKANPAAVDALEVKLGQVASATASPAATASK